MIHLIGHHLAIDSGTFQYFWNRYVAGQMIEQRQVIKDPVRFVQSAQINNYTARELYWLGIDTAEGKDGLVAIITIRGATQRYSDWYMEGTEWIAQQLAICNGNPLVNAIMLRIDSPGGMANGAPNLSASIRGSKKPTLGWASNMAASASYWYLSQCSECYLENEFTALGSIGTMMVCRDMSEALAKAGDKYTILRSAGAEDKNPLNGIEPFGGEQQQKALEQEQHVLDASRRMFLKEVQQKRTGLTQDPGGAIFYGKDALKLDLADGMMSFEDALKRTDVLGIQYKRQVA